MGRVTERVGALRIWRRGRGECCSAAPFVSVRVRFGTLGRRGGGGRRNERCDDGGEPLGPSMGSEVAVGMIGKGDEVG